MAEPVRLPLVPENVGSLFSPATRRRLRWAMVGSVVSTLADVAGVAAILPLMQLITGGGAGTGGSVDWIRDRLGRPDVQTTSYILAGFVVAVFVAKGLFNIVFRRWMIRFVSFQAVETGNDLLRRYLSAPYWVHLQRNTAELVRTLLDGVDQTYTLVVVGAVGAAAEGFTIVALFLALVVVMPGPAVGALCYFAICGIAVDRLLRRRASHAGEVLADSAHQVYVTAFQALGGVKEIKVRQRGEHFLDNYGRARREFAEARATSGYLAELPRYLLEIVFIVGVGLVAAAVYSAHSGPPAIAQLALFVAAGFRLLPSLVRLTQALASIRLGRAGADLVLADINSDVPVEAWADATQSDLTLREEMRIEDVSYRYPSGTFDVVRGVDLTLPAGRSLALVGPSGAGKSTLVDLVLGLHRPTSGRITVDGVDVNEQMPQWQRTIGLVPQDVYLLDESLRSNIAFGEAADVIDDERIAEAVTRSQLDDLVASLPDGLDTFVGERGVRLSGGQRQRIGIARALYLRPQLLVLDEATSALDNETERRITTTIDALRGEMSILVVAHRLSTVRSCDQVVFLADGEVAAQGTFDEVREADADFARLVELGDLSRHPVDLELR